MWAAEASDSSCSTPVGRPLLTITQPEIINIVHVAVKAPNGTTVL